MSLCEHYSCIYFIVIIEKKQVNKVCVRGVEMIKYDRLWKTMKEKGVSQYALYTTYNINRSQLNRLRHNQNVQVNTIDKLCNILHCQVEDIMEHVDDDNIF